MEKILLNCLLILILSGCVTHPNVTPEEKIHASLYRSKKPPTVSLITIYANDKLTEHSGLIINGDHRVIFDPAGRFQLHKAASKFDLFYGANPQVLHNYLSHYLDRDHKVVVQTIQVPLAVANELIFAAQNHKPAYGAFCSYTISNLLTSNKYFNSLGVYYVPENTMKAFAKLNKVQTNIYSYEDKAKTIMDINGVS